MKEALTKLIKVKSIITILMAIAFIILTFLSVISGEQFYSLFQIIIAFYFGSQTEKKGEK